MIIVLVIISLGLLSLIIYYAFSPKSSRILKLSALIALGAIFISLLVCGIALLIGPEGDPGVVPLPPLPGTPPPAQQESRVMDIIILGVFLLVLGLIIAKAVRDQQKLALKQRKAAKPRPVFQETHELYELEHPVEEDSAKEEDNKEENFDIDL